MCIFDFFKSNKKDDNIQPLSAYLEQYPSWILFENAEKLMNVQMYVSEQGRPIRLNTYTNISSFIKTNEYKDCELEKGISIPKKYHKEVVSIIDFLETASNQGDSKADFILFMIYDNGLNKLYYAGDYISEDRRKLRDNDNATLWRARAREKNDAFEKAYSWIEKNTEIKPGIPVAKIESILAEMAVSANDELLEIIGSKEMLKIFNKIGMFALSGLAQMGFAYAMGYLTNLLYSMDMSNDLKEKLPGLAIFKYVNETNMKESALWMAKSLIKRANFADEAAEFTVKNFEFEIIK